MNTSTTRRGFLTSALRTTVLALFTSKLATIVPAQETPEPEFVASASYEIDYFSLGPYGMECVYRALERQPLAAQYEPRKIGSSLYRRIKIVS